MYYKTELHQMPRATNDEYSPLRPIKPEPAEHNEDGEYQARYADLLSADDFAAERLSTDCIAVDNWPRYQVDYLPRFTHDGDPRSDWRDTACGLGYNAEDHMRYYDWEQDVESVRHGDGTECSDTAFCKNV